MHILEPIWNEIKVYTFIGNIIMDFTVGGDILCLLHSMGNLFKEDYIRIQLHDNQILFQFNHNDRYLINLVLPHEGEIGGTYPPFGLKLSQLDQGDVILLDEGTLLGTSYTITLPMETTMEPPHPYPLMDIPLEPLFTLIERGVNSLVVWEEGKVCWKGGEIELGVSLPSQHKIWIRGDFIVGFLKQLPLGGSGMIGVLVDPISPFILSYQVGNRVWEFISVHEKDEREGETKQKCYRFG